MLQHKAAATILTTSALQEMQGAATRAAGAYAASYTSAALHLNRPIHTQDLKGHDPLSWEQPLI